MSNWTSLRRALLAKQSAWLLALILVVALALRLWALDFGLPHLFHPDEDAVVMPALLMLKTGNLEPDRFEYGSLQIYALTAVSTIVYLYLARAGLVGDPTQLPIYERGAYPMTYALLDFFLAARLLSAVAGVGIVLMVYMLTRRLANQRQALVAAAITAVTPMLVDNAHYATPDTLLTFWTLFTLYLLVRAYDNWDTGNLWAYVGAAFVGGLATSTKYNGAVLLVPVLFVPLLKNKSLDDYLSLRTLGGPLGFVAGFLATSPFALLNLPLFLKWAGYAFRLYNQPSANFAVPSWQWHLQYLATSREAPVFIVGLLGFFFSLKQWGRRGWIVNSFALFFTLAIFTQTGRQPRMWLPLAPIFAAWAALFIDTAAHYIQKKMAQRVVTDGRNPVWRATFATYLPVVLALLLLLPAFAASLRIVSALQGPDVRLLAANWIETNVPAGAVVAVDYFPPNVDTAVWPVVRTFRHSQHDLDWFTEQNVAYLIFSQGIYSEQRLPPAEEPAYQLLLGQLCPVETVYGSFISNPDFTMRIYRVPPCS